MTEKFLSCNYSNCTAILFTAYPNGNCYKKDILKDKKAQTITRAEFDSEKELAKYSDYFEESEE